MRSENVRRICVNDVTIDRSYVTLMYKNAHTFV
jgi:hypothetical protein